MPLLVVIGLLALVSFPLYRHPGNVVAVQSAGSTASQNQPTPILQAVAPSPVYADWGALDGVELLVRKNVPFLSLRLQPGWDMRSSAGVDYDLAALGFGGGQLCQPPETERATNFPPADAKPCTPGFYPWGFRASGVSAEFLAGVFSILNMLMWPLVLAFAIRRVLRQ